MANLLNPAQIVNISIPTTGYSLDDRGTWSLLEKKANPTIRLAYVSLRHRVRFKPTTIIFDGKERRIEPGQVVFTASWLAAILGKRHRSTGTRVARSIADLLGIEVEVSNHSRSGGIILTFKDWNKWHKKFDIKNHRKESPSVAASASASPPKNLPDIKKPSHRKQNNKMTGDSGLSRRGAHSNPNNNIDDNIERKSLLRSVDKILAEYAKVIGKPSSRQRDAFKREFLEKRLDEKEVLRNLEKIKSDQWLLSTTKSPLRLFHNPSGYQPSYFKLLASQVNEMGLCCKSVSQTYKALNDSLSDGESMEAIIRRCRKYTFKNSWARKSGFWKYAAERVLSESNLNRAKIANNGTTLN